MRHHRAHRIALTLTLAAALTTGCGGRSAPGSAVPPPPAVVDLPDPIPPPPADGLQRFVVRPPGSAAVDHGPGGGGEAMAPPGLTDPAWALDIGLIGRIEDDTVVEFRDGVAGFVDADGEFIPLVGYRPDSPFVEALAQARAEAEAEAARSAAGDSDTGPDGAVVKALLSVDGVASAVAIGDGSYAVATDDPEALLGLGLETAVDAPLALAADDPYQPYQWTLDNDGHNLDTLAKPPAQVPDADIDGREAADAARGREVVVAVIDTGVDFSHPDLAGQSWVNGGEICGNSEDDDGNGFVDDCLGWDFGNEDPDSYSPGQNDHGTHVAGIIGAVAGNGIGVAGLAPEVRIMGLNVEGPGGMSTSSVARAVRYAVDNGADVINMSLGTQPGTPAASVQPMFDAIDHADRHGVLVVVAAGNSSVDIGSSAVYPASIDGPNMIVAGASAPDETRASFSNYGQPVDLFAPGVLILSTVPGGYSFMSGTSQASPTIAAIAADVIAANPGLDPAAVRQQVVGTADELGAYANLAANPVRLNAARALGLTVDTGEVEVTIGGLGAAGTASVVADVAMHVPAGAFDRAFHWEASLVVVDDSGQAYGLVDHPVSVDWEEVDTDSRGAMLLGASGADQARLETSLPPGSYGLVVEAVPEDDQTVRLGDAFVSTFVVADDAPTPDDNSAGSTTTTVPSGGTTTTVPSAGTTTTVPSAGPTTVPSGGGSTTVPSGGGSTTTQPSAGPTTTTAPTTPGAPSSTTASTAATTTTVPSGGTAPTTSSTVVATTSTVPWWSTTTRLATTTAPAPTTTAPAPTTTVLAPTTTAPVPTIAPSTTKAPATTAPPTTVAPTSAPPTTAGGTTPTTTSGGGFVIRSITPASGPTGEWTMVSISGTFPSLVHVWFGDGPGDVVYHSNSWILVMAPPRSTSGAVDVSLRSASAGTVLLVDDGYSYVGPGGTTSTTSPSTSPTTAPSEATSTSTSTSTTSTSTSTSTTSPSGGPTTTTTAPSGGGPTTSSGQASTTTSGTQATEPPLQTTSTTAAGSGSGSGSGSTTVSRAVVTGGPVDLGQGLRGVALQGLGGLADVPACASDPCRTRRV